MQRKSALIAVSGSVGAYALLRHLRYPKDASKFLSVALYGLTAAKDDLETVTPFLLTPALMHLLRRLNSSLFTKILYAVSFGYLSLELLHSAEAVPKNLRKFGERNSALPLPMLNQWRTECVSHGWVTRETTMEFLSSFTQEDAKRAMKNTAFNMGKAQLQIMGLRMLMRRSLRINVMQNVSEWARTVMFLWICSVLLVVFPAQYNKLAHRFSKHEKIEEYRLNKTSQWTMFALAVFIGLHAQRSSKHRMLASYAFVCAMITQIKKRSMRINDFLPFICYLFGRY